MGLGGASLTPRQAVVATAALLRSGLVRFYRPDRLLRISGHLARYRFGPGMGPIVGAAVYPDAPAIVDDTGVVCMRELEARCAAVAGGLAAAGVTAGDTLGLLARNSREFYEVVVGASRVGADVTYLNTGFTAEQVADAVERRRLRALVYDVEFVDRVPEGVLTIPTSPDTGGPSVWAMAETTWPAPGRPANLSRHVILTSGTTGAPKGVPRTGGGLDSIVALLSGLPYRVRETHLIAAPMFHAWGWLHLMLTMLFSSTAVLMRRFDPVGALELIERERCEVLVAVPAMLQKIMDLPVEIRRSYDVSSLRVVAVSGSALSGRLATEFMDEFGDVLYSLYGSTEVGYATVAGPVDLRVAPGTAGRALPGVLVEVLDEQGEPCPPGQPGAIRVRGTDTASADEAGTGGEGRTGDLGWLDGEGRLFIGGREDDMVIVGGENVYPVVVEQLLERHPAVVEAAVVGAADRVLGQVLVAHVVLRAGGAARPEALREWCREHLAGFQVPRRIVVHDALPRNETGKVVKTMLRV
jgi:acyl-CoA synthetase (AMP-forming)/AMP-acid ligase II